MKKGVLLSSELEKRFAEVGRQEDNPDPIVIAKFINPIGRGTWYATEYYPDDRLFFGWVSLFGDWNDEFGYFSLDDLQEYRSSWGTGIIRVLDFVEQPLSTAKEK